MVCASAAALCSCYFNSAGVIMQHAAYEASVDTADVQVGQGVLSDGKAYYLELPRYLAEQKSRRTYVMMDDAHYLEPPYKTAEVSLVQISESFARYLTGREAAEPTQPLIIGPVANEAAVRAAAVTRLPIVREPASQQYRFVYRSSGRLLWYALAAVDWVCVDLPMTCVQNAFFLPLSPLYVLGATPEEKPDHVLFDKEKEVRRIRESCAMRGYMTIDESQQVRAYLVSCTQVLHSLRADTGATQAVTDVSDALPDNAAERKRQALRISRSMQDTTSWLEHMRLGGNIR